MTTTMPALSAADDAFHPPVGDAPYWTETAWFAFDIPERSLSGSIYPLFRPNLGICSLAVHVWDDTGSTPWDALYSRLLWHLPMPTGDLRRLEFEGLRYTTLDPLSRYHVEYRDGEHLSLDLEYTGHRAPSISTTQVPTQVTGISHFDQACDVRGQITVAGETFDFTGFGHRDRSWYDRPDNQPRRSASVSFGDQSADEQFILFRALNLLTDEAAAAPLGGYLIHDGVHSPLVTATRRVVERVDGRPRRFVLSLRDAEGRTLEAEGRAVNNFAFQCSPPVFAWFTQVDWSTDHGRFIGEDQESHSSRDTRRNFRLGAG